MDATITRIDVSKEFPTSEGCLITELHNNSADEAVSIARAKVPKGVTTRWHRLSSTVERYCIVNGTGVVEVGDLPPQEVTVGDVVYVPPMCRQRISNRGDDELVFLAICTPRFDPKVYEDIEDASKQS